MLCDNLLMHDMSPHRSTLTTATYVFRVVHFQMKCWIKKQKQTILLCVISKKREKSDLVHECIM